MREVEDLLLDKLFNNVEVIELATQLNLIEILQNHVVESIVSSLYMGKYVRESIFNKSLVYNAMMEGVENVPGKDARAIRKLSIFSYNRIHEENYMKESQHRVRHARLKSGNVDNVKSVAKSENHVVKNKKTVGHFYQYKIWKTSIDVQHKFATVLTIILAALMISFANNIQDQANKVQDQKDILTNLESQTQTAAILDQIEQEYDVLDAISQTYYAYIIGFLVLTILSCAYFVRNIGKYLDHN